MRLITLMWLFTPPGHWYAWGLTITSRCLRLSQRPRQSPPATLAERLEGVPVPTGQAPDMAGEAVAVSLRARLASAGSGATPAPASRSTRAPAHRAVNRRGAAADGAEQAGRTDWPRTCG